MSPIWKSVGWVAAIGFGYALAVMAADGVPAPVTAATAHDPLLAYLQAAGFPTWAVVLLLIGRQVSGELKGISNRLDAHITQTELRLAKLELHDPDPPTHCPARRRGEVAN